MTVVLAHPLTEAARLGVAPAFVALTAVVLTVVAARALAALPVRDGDSRVVDDDAEGQPVVLTRPPVIARALGLGLLLLAVVAGRIGSPVQIDNIAPALVIGVGWPALLVGSALFGGIWDRLNPFDTLARATGQEPGPSAASERPLHVGAALGAVGWTWWLAGYIPGGLDPRAIGLGLGVYTLVTVGACLYAGRRAWLAEGEVFTVTFRAIAAARTTAGDRLGGATAARHLPVLGLVVGGLAFAELRFSAWYLADLEALGLDGFAPGTVLTGFLLACALGLATTLGAARWSLRTGVLDAMGAVVPWLVVGLGLSAALERDRLWNAVQLLLVQASDPLGRGWDLFGTANWAVSSWPHGDVGRLWVQVACLAVPVLVGLIIALRRAPGRRGDAVIAYAGGWTVLAVLSAASL